TDRALLQALGDGTRHADEKLLVMQNGEEVELALYLDADLMQRLREDDPTRRLHDGNISDFCTALEGVSHFLYLTWNAGHERGVSLLELEMQAEVDKYVSTAMLFGSQDDGKIPQQLYAWLFDDPVFDESLDGESLKRYRDANYYASRYCSQIQTHYFRERRSGNLMNELRRFYRLPQHHKIKRIESAA
ncbi:MAG TPA: hypothetical protein VLS27_16510, partial [Gammaproteobacteria bacterium]|nr:hypothetical protein [Gammaproteobacteria bacterium]